MHLLTRSGKADDRDIRAANIIIVGLFFSIIAVFYTWPLVLHLNSAVYGIWGDKYGGDVFYTIYSYWSAKYAWMHGIPLYKNSLIAYPFGVEGMQVFGLRLPGELFIGTLLAILVNEIFSYNVLIFSSFVLAGLTTYILVQHVVRNRIAAIISGVIFAFSPYHLYVSVGWLELSQIQWIPLYFFCLIKTSERKSYSWGILSGLILSLISLTTLYYGYFMAVMTVVFICFKVIYELRGKSKFDYLFLKKFLFGMAVGFIIIIAGLYKFLSGDTLSKNSYDVYKLSGVVARSARPLDFLLPSVAHPFFGSFIKNLRGTYISPTYNVMDIFIGYTPLLLASYGIVKWLKEKGNDYILNFSTALFITIAITALILSCPPFIKIGDLRIYMPSYLMYLVAPMLKSVARYSVVIMCAVSVLAGIGLKYVLNKKANWKKKVLVFSIFISLIVFEFQNSNTMYASRAFEIPNLYNWLAVQPGKFAIAEYPAFSNLDNRNLYYRFFQRIHKQPMMNGAPERSTEDAIRISIANLITPGVPKMLNFLGIKYVIIHEDFYEGLDIPNIYPLLAIDGLRLVKRFDNERVYEVIAESDDIIILPHEHFYAPERHEGGKLWRWLRDSAHINFFNTTQETISAKISFKAKSFSRKRWLNMRYGAELLQREIPASEAILLELETSLLPGSNFIRFYVDSKPDEITIVSGTKDVSIYMGDLQIRTVNGDIYEDR